jgi:uncharacterized protein (DUF2147 family)
MRHGCIPARVAAISLLHFKDSKSMLGKCISATLVIIAYLLAGPTVLAATPAGLWLTQRQDAKVRIANCGRNTICGTVVWLREPIDPRTGQPHVDDKNPDPRLKNRKIIGLRLFSMSLSAPGTWSGKIYNADDGRYYDARISLSGANALTVLGCAGPFCGSETWTRTK